MINEEQCIVVSHREIISILGKNGWTYIYISPLSQGFRLEISRKIMKIYVIMQFHTDDGIQSSNACRQLSEY